MNTQRTLAPTVAASSTEAPMRKPRPLLAVALKRLDIGSVQAGGAGAGVDLRAQAGHSQIGKCYPLTQTHNGQMVKCLQYG